MDTLRLAASEAEEMVRRLAEKQSPDGTWRYCFEMGTMTDALTIITFRSLEVEEEATIEQCAERLLRLQEENGAWKQYADEKDGGNLPATVEAYYALLYSGKVRPEEERMRRAKQYILSRGGLPAVDSLMTKLALAATGQYPWPRSFRIPIEFLLLPPSSPLSFYDFVGFARVHIAPVLVMTDRRFALRTARSPDLSDLFPGGSREMRPDELDRAWADFFGKLASGLGKLAGAPEQLHRQAVRQAERYMLERIESDGLLYSYASATFMMIFGLLALGYEKRHPVIEKAVRGIKDSACRAGTTVHIQNSLSTVWDTALLSHALLRAGLSPAHPVVRRAGAYLLSRQHRKRGDWAIRNPEAVPGGWGFTDATTLNPDVDDTSAALRVMKPMIGSAPGESAALYRGAYNRGLQWLLSMQNDDGGWPAFEKNTDNRLLTLLPVDGADAAAIDPSSADLTGRALQFLGDTAGLANRLPNVRRAVRWLERSQETDGSWYGRWGVCYVYGTWAALTGLLAAGCGGDHSAVRQGVRWLLDIRQPDGGWGESCASDRRKAYTPLAASTPSQTAWALDALIAASSRPTAEIDQGIRAMLESLRRGGWAASYPTGAALNGVFYIRYESYNDIWPLLTLANYIRKYG